MKLNINNKLLSILILALVLRLISLNQSLWLDEAINALAVKNLSLFDLVTKYTINDFHPPLYHIVLLFWTRVFGFSEVILRLPSVLFTLLSMVVTYFIGRDFFSKKIGLISALLFAVSPLSIYYSQEARMYALAVLFASLSFYFFLHLKNGDFSNKFIFGFLLSVISGMYSDYIFWIFAFILLVYLGISTKHKPKVFLICLVILLSILPWTPFLINQLRSGLSTAGTEPIWKAVVGEGSLKSLLLIPVKFSIGRISFYNKLNYFLYLFPVVLINFFAVLKAFSNYKKEIKPLLVWLVAPISISFIISFFVPVFSYFRFLFVLPAFLLILSLGMKKNIFLLYLFVFFSLISSLTYLFIPRFHREDWKGAVSFIENNSSVNSVSLLANIAQGAPYNYYSKLNPLIDEKNLKADYDKIFFIRYAQPIFDPKENVLKKVESLGFTKSQEKDFNGVTVWEYKK